MECCGMTIGIIDFDVLSDDEYGRVRFVVFVQGLVDLEIGTIVQAKVFASKAGASFPCEVYRPRSNGPLDPPHLHMRAGREYQLDKTMTVGDNITIV